MLFFKKNGLFLLKIELFKAILVKRYLPNGFKVGVKRSFAGWLDGGEVGA